MAFAKVTKRRVRYLLVLCTLYLYPPPFSLPLSTTKQQHPHGQRKHPFSHEGFHCISWSFPYIGVSWSVLKFFLHRSIPYLDKEEVESGWWGEARQGGQGGQGGPHWHWVQVHISQALNTLNFKFHYVHWKDCILHTKHFIMQTAHQGCRKVALLGYPSPTNKKSSCKEKNFTIQMWVPSNICCQLKIASKQNTSLHSNMSARHE